MEVTIKVEGLAETVRALQKIDRDAKKELYRGFRNAAKPIATDIKALLERYNEISLKTIRPHARISGVTIEQNKLKVTGERPDFGALQMRKGFIPAATAGIPLIEADVRKAIDELIAREGF